jgi:tetratricopeptide (TPR) repeat protein
MTGEPARIEELLSRAHAARRAGDRAASVAHLEAALRLAPWRRDLCLERGNDLIELGRLEAAAAAFAALRAAAPDDAGAMLGQGRIARRRGDHAAALACFCAALAAMPHDTGARLDVAYALLDLHRTDEAQAAFRAVLDDQPQQPGALLGLGRIRRRGGDRAAALGFAERAAAADPSHVGARLEMISDLLALGRLAAAEQAYAEVLAVAPHHVDALLGLGRLLRQTGRRAEALRHFEAALARDPAHRGALLDVAYERLDRGEWEAAEMLFRRVLADAPLQAGALTGLARIARYHGDRAGARRLLEQAVAADPADSGARLDLAAELRDAGEYAAALALIEGVIRDHPGDLAALLHRGTLEQTQGAHAAARATFEAAAAQHPTVARPLVDAAVSARALGQPEDATALLNRALAITPDDPQALGALADLAWIAEDYPGCLALSEQVLARRTDLTWPYVLGARALGALGRQQEAQALLDRVTAGAARAEVLAERVELLTRAGEWPAARALLAENAAELPRSIRLWGEQVKCDLAYGAFDAAAAALAAPPQPGSPRSRARTNMLRGRWAELQWRLDEAAEHYREAARLNPDEADRQDDLARVCLLRLDVEAAAQRNLDYTRLNATAAKLRRQSQRPAQSQLGQVLNEFRMDPAVVAELARLYALPPAKRIAGLRQQAARTPGHTPTAIQLVLALRQAGMLAPRAKAATPAIPRRIVQFWDAAEPPDDVAALMHTVRGRNPDWEYVRFDLAAAEAFLSTHFPPAVAWALRRARHPASKADLFRLAYLHRHGGIYIDADDRAIGPLEAIVPASAKLLTYQESYSTLGNNVLGAVPGHPVIARALAEAVAALNRGDGESLWLCTGPGLLTRAFAAEFATTPVQPRVWLGRVAILERAELLGAVAVHCFARYKSTMAHWDRGEFGAAPGKAAPPA